MQGQQRELEIDKRIAKQCIKNYYNNELVVDEGKIVGDENIAEEFNSFFSRI
ncbi:Hypothetical predicted protein, partial [Paramuricea clavata]